MKATKKLLAFLLAATMLLALLPSAFATEPVTYTLTINNSTIGHTYEAYQIFTGDLTKKDGGSLVLSNIVWGSGISEAGRTALGNAAEVAATLTDEAAAKDFAKKIAQYLTSPTTSTQGDGKYTISGLQPGYYLVKDQDNTLDEEHDFYTAYIMEVVGNVTATPKGDKPTLDKQIKHNETENWGVVGDNQIGDTVEFRTITSVPNVEDYYTAYSYVISDTMSAGLTSNVETADDVTIKVNDSAVLESKYYTVVANGNTFSVTIDILTAIADKKMAVNDRLYTYYTGVLNSDAKVYDEGKQENAAYLEFSNNPNDTEDKGKTPEKKVYDWTFKMGVNKVNKEGDPLTGAKFVLSKDGSLKVEDMGCNDEGVPTTTTGLIPVVKVSDGVYRVATDKDTGTTFVMEAGSIVIKGLDDEVDYYLYETKAPEGYNQLKEPVRFKITADYVADGSALAEGYPTVTVGTNTSNELTTNVINQAGNTLPSTGGMGTTIFYVLGSILAIGAAILLISKKRMNGVQ